MLFINELQNNLQDYKISGNAKEVLQSLRQNLSKFPGQHLQPLLKKIIIEIEEDQQKIPADYHKIIVNGTFDEVHKIANITLDKLNNHPKYVNTIKGLYQQIAHLHDYAKHLPNKSDSIIVSNLAKKLRNDIDRFVCAHPDTLPQKNHYEQFKEKFITRLHSENETMNKHRAAWKPLLANIVIGLLTVGIALGIKLLHSKLNTGHSSLFFANTHRQEKLLAMETSLTKLLNH
jgi:hypothetical protein